MSERHPRHVFDRARAAQFLPKETFVKTAVLLEVADPEEEVRVSASFGIQHMRGGFYVVASEDGSYGAARTEFEKTHEQVGPTQWVKRAGVEAYRAVEPCEVETYLADGTRETSVTAEPGDWIVRQAAGEVMVITPEAFAKRYMPAD